MGGELREISQLARSRFQPKYMTQGRELECIASVRAGNLGCKMYVCRM